MPVGPSASLSPTLILDDEPPADTGPSMPTPWTGTEDGGEIEAPDLALVEATAQEGLMLTLERAPGPIFEPYFEAMSTRHEDCLRYSEQQTGQATHVNWSGSGACSQPESSQFVGMASSLQGENMRLADSLQWPASLVEAQDGFVPDDFSVTGRFMLGQAYIWTPDDERFNGAGLMCELSGGSESAGTQFWIQTVSGVFSWSGAVDDASWFTGDSSLDWDVRIDREANGSISVSLAGGMTDLPETGGIFATDELRVSRDASDSDACGDEPEGSLAVRTDDGSWVEVTFDAWDGGVCDGCGPAVWQGEELGQVCVDVNHLFDWQDSPW